MIKMNSTPKNLKLTYILTRLLIIIGILCAASVLGLIFRELDIHDTNIAIIYMLAVVLATLLAPDYIFGFIASILSAFAFNFLFTAPYFTFTANAPSYIITFVIMTIAAFITSSLASHAKISARQAQKREEETKALYGLTDRLIEATDLHSIAEIAVEAVHKAICEHPGCLCFDEEGFPEKTFVQQTGPQQHKWQNLEDPKGLLTQISHLSGDRYMGNIFHDFPVYGKETMLGLIRIPREEALLLSKGHERLLHSMIESIALAMDRYRSIKQRALLREETQQERYRSNILRSISHDLRTPLSGILGSIEILFDMTDKEDPRYKLVKGIDDDAHWLFSLVENVLSLTRLQSGKLLLNKQLEVVEEILGGAVAYMQRRYPDYRIEASSPEELLLAPMDARLINQVLINLMDNAIKHTPPSGEIRLSVRQDIPHNEGVFSIKDTGSGIPEEELPHIFQMFHTSSPSHPDAQKGIGLGLAICESIVKAHGGKIQAMNRNDTSGAEVIFTLPLEATDEKI